jgi:hypothetical protein
LKSKGAIPFVVIYGPPASGKLTVAQQLSQLTNLKLFHNHLTVDLLLSVFEFGSPAFVTFREQIWLSVMLQACEEKIGLIFTFTPERTVSEGFLNLLIDEATSCGADVRVVELVCSESKIEQRLAGPGAAGLLGRAVPAVVPLSSIHLGDHGHLVPLRV